MKKLTGIILALTLILCFSVPAFAANETGGQTDLTLTYTPPAPTYTVTIPATLTVPLNSTGADMNIEASAIADLGGKSVNVAWAAYNAGTNNGALTTAATPTGDQLKTIPYSIYANDTAKNFGDTLLTFDANGTKAINVRVTSTNAITDPGRYVVPNSAYTGSIVFVISLA